MDVHTCFGLAVAVWRAVCSRKQRWNRVPTCQGHWDTAGFSADFALMFAWLWNTDFSFNTKTSKKTQRKICAPSLGLDSEQQNSSSKTRYVATMIAKWSALGGSIGWLVSSRMSSFVIVKQSNTCGGEGRGAAQRREREGQQATWVVKMIYIYIYHFWSDVRKVFVHKIYPEFPGLENCNLEMQDCKNQAFNTECNLQWRMFFSLRASAVAEKNSAGNDIFNRKLTFQTENEISSENGSVVRGGMVVFDPFEGELIFDLQALWVGSTLW